MTTLVLTLLCALAAAVPLGWWLARVLSAGPTPGEAAFAWIERPIYAALRPDKSGPTPASQAPAAESLRDTPAYNGARFTRTWNSRN